MCSAVVLIYSAVDSTDEQCRVLTTFAHVYFFNRPIRHVQKCFKQQFVYLNELHEVCTVPDIAAGSWQQSYVKYVMFGRCAARCGW